MCPECAQFHELPTSIIEAAAIHDARALCALKLVTALSVESSTETLTILNLHVGME
ncbi:hypothetical protein HMPREF9622_02424 [Cutibacterium modestum HL037PA3]|uniref:Uncharacterized protein n=1 Tax=Cutibacterium modestum HL044PA1 TaxID=765109 RepID=A0ABN0C5D4_9ACTN|nr:hypothetical protein HMPREF9621_02236 [Cutibacterium modestum HL037PA2]EFS92479.1 hypothetical protein HMPREF9607_01423 [Cutibacterium modestum HL044PA1]EFT14488.1 hypothetical protein HMPREF9622_02424 [Cutibacterium modestum HL037PA3]EGG28025.1 hypothetical protein PA08_0253 [Cutibacterium modestum P08]